MLYTQGIYIDGMYFDVPLVSVKREAKVLDKFAEREEESGKNNLANVSPS